MASIPIRLWKGKGLSSVPPSSSPVICLPSRSLPRDCSRARTFQGEAKALASEVLFAVPPVPRDGRQPPASSLARLPPVCRSRALFPSADGRGRVDTSERGTAAGEREDGRGKGGNETGKGEGQTAQVPGRRWATVGDRDSPRCAANTHLSWPTRLPHPLKDRARKISSARLGEARRVPLERRRYFSVALRRCHSSTERDIVFSIFPRKSPESAGDAGDASEHKAERERSLWEGRRVQERGVKQKAGGWRTPERCGSLGERRRGSGSRALGEGLKKPTDVSGSPERGEREDKGRQDGILCDGGEAVKDVKDAEGDADTLAWTQEQDEMKRQLEKLLSTPKHVALWLNALAGQLERMQRRQNQPPNRRETLAEEKTQGGLWQLIVDAAATARATCDKTHGGTRPEVTDLLRHGTDRPRSHCTSEGRLSTSTISSSAPSPSSSSASSCSVLSSSHSSSSRSSSCHSSASSVSLSSASARRTACFWTWAAELLCRRQRAEGEGGTRRPDTEQSVRGSYSSSLSVSCPASSSLLPHSPSSVPSLSASSSGSRPCASPLPSALSSCTSPPSSTPSIRGLAMAANACVRLHKLGREHPHVVASLSSCPPPCDAVPADALTANAGGNRPVRLASSAVSLPEEETQEERDARPTKDKAASRQRAVALRASAAPALPSLRDLRECLLTLLLSIQNWEEAAQGMNEQDASLLVHACATADLFFPPLFSALSTRLSPPTRGTPETRHHTPAEKSDTRQELPNGRDRQNGNLVGVPHPADLSSLTLATDAPPSASQGGVPGSPGGPPRSRPVASLPSVSSRPSSPCGEPAAVRSPLSPPAASLSPQFVSPPPSQLLLSLPLPPLLPRSASSSLPLSGAANTARTALPRRSAISQADHPQESSGTADQAPLRATETARELTEHRESDGDFLASFSPQGLSLLLHGFAALRVSLSPALAARLARSVLATLHATSQAEAVESLHRREREKPEDARSSEGGARGRRNAWQGRGAQNAEEKRTGAPVLAGDGTCFHEHRVSNARKRAEESTAADAGESDSGGRRGELQGGRGESEASSGARRPRQDTKDEGKRGGPSGVCTPKQAVRLVYSLCELPDVPRPLAKQAAVLLSQGRLRTNPEAFSIQGRLLALRCFLSFDVREPEGMHNHLAHFLAVATPQGLANVFSAVAKLDVGRTVLHANSPLESLSAASAHPYTGGARGDSRYADVWLAASCSRLLVSQRTEPRHVIACCFAAAASFAGTPHWHAGLLFHAFHIPLAGTPGRGREAYEGESPAESPAVSRKCVSPDRGTPDATWTARLGQHSLFSLLTSHSETPTRSSIRTGTFPSSAIPTSQALAPQLLKADTTHSEAFVSREQSPSTLLGDAECRIRRASSKRAEGEDKQKRGGSGKQGGPPLQERRRDPVFATDRSTPALGLVTPETMDEPATVQSLSACGVTVQTVSQLQAVLLHLAFEFGDSGGLSSLHSRVLRAAISLLDCFLHASLPYAHLREEALHQTKTGSSFLESPGGTTTDLERSWGEHARASLPAHEREICGAQTSSFASCERVKGLCPQPLLQDVFRPPIMESEAKGRQSDLRGNSNGRSGNEGAIPFDPHYEGFANRVKSSRLHCEVLDALRGVVRVRRNSASYGGVLNHSQNLGPCLLVSEALIPPYVVDIAVHPVSRYRGSSEL
ncbi:putative sodium:solute symporter family domain-containing protein [Neospora caninum Liverpool]|uniref:Putative sodium:solute symporter family domain-containing protein n=1 Tax=Neospora caninum (strain Liverpool) TaxID=572307 RepID=F0VMH3_NEOCL|nr:putative sodium:solute symporter family domain-containing protein [Neospora caninum Liverpool]CBZ54919.1 putative sodium:solute symporter family domain-containing protein [Neospora caninum Liverpool]|eukprot:XP_003884947.1 putative sodium:solute symporter family domain-containing protein [Neospora caninum Liverpool]